MPSNFSRNKARDVFQELVQINDICFEKTHVYGNAATQTYYDHYRVHAHPNAEINPVQVGASCKI